MDYNVTTVKEQLNSKLLRYFNLKDESVSEIQLYTALSSLLRDILLQKNTDFKSDATKKNAKRVYYISMEYLIGRNLRNVLYNLGLTAVVRDVIASYGYELEKLYDLERDPGIGNGGLGRLAACYLDALSSLGIPATGFSILYEYGIFKQKIVDGWQMELPDEWLSSGEAWLLPRHDESVEVHFGGYIEEHWENDRMIPVHKDYFTVISVPYTLPIPGYGEGGVNELRLWQAKAVSTIDLALFSSGQYNKAVEQNTMAEVISKVLYPEDNHFEGKSLRLKQQYFLVSSTIQYILKHHKKRYGTLESLPEHAAIQINDTHPAMVIPELMRILMDEEHYDWDKAWNIVIHTVAYTNHTIMPEALEQWPVDLFKLHLPRIYTIVCEINRRFCQFAFDMTGGDWNRVAAMSVVCDEQVRMANLSIIGSHAVNGVSALHSDILKNDVFSEFVRLEPDKFTNVTNGIAHRRWLCQANPLLDGLIADLIGGGFRSHAQELEGLLAYREDQSVLKRLGEIKYANKQRLAALIRETNSVSVDPNAIFDVQVKRLHEYKRQLLNILRIVELYLELLENPDAVSHQQVYVFGAKAAAGYYSAKRIIQLINCVSEVVNNDPRIQGKLKVVFMEDYRVTSAEIIIPAAEISEQISQAGKEASGTGNMKFMINGAITLGTLDGANVEIHQHVGDDNMFLFGMTADQVQDEYHTGYQPTIWYQRDEKLQRAVQAIADGMFKERFTDITHNLLTNDHFMILKDLDSYCQAHKRAEAAYEDPLAWNRMSLVNIAHAGIFSADRSISEYARNIWQARSIIYEEI